MSSAMTIPTATPSTSRSALGKYAAVLLSAATIFIIMSGISYLLSDHFSLFPGKRRDEPEDDLAYYVSMLSLILSVVAYCSAYVLSIIATLKRSRIGFVVLIICCAIPLLSPLYALIVLLLTY